MDQDVELEDLRDRFRGCLLGVAIGDALGARFEGTAHLRAVELGDLGSGPLRYTDDTHMTLGLAESLVEREGFDEADLAGRWAENFASEPWRGYGAGPPQVFRMLERGVPWDQAGGRLFGGAGSFGNGAAMRAAPVALLAFSNPTRVVDLAGRQARITHAHPLGVEGAVLQASAVAAVLRRPSAARLAAGALLEELRKGLHEQEMLEKLNRLQGLLPDAPIEVVVDRLGHGIEAFRSVPTALYCFLRHRLSFADAVRFAISLGGDTDTIASMTGALAGAHLGAERIPTTWRSRVEGAARLTAQADRLLALAQGPSA